MKRAAILFFILASGLRGQEATTITIRKGDTTSVALVRGQARWCRRHKILQNDLDLSGWFSLTPPERATYVISGSASGGPLQGEVRDQRGSVVLQKAYSGGTRAAAHRFADDIVETVTGHKGIASSKIAFVSSHSGHKENLHCRL
jgi:TolB protein